MFLVFEWCFLNMQVLYANMENRVDNPPSQKVQYHDRRSEKSDVDILSRTQLFDLQWKTLQTPVKAAINPIGPDVLQRRWHHFTISRCRNRITPSKSNWSDIISQCGGSSIENRISWCHPLIKWNSTRIPTISSTNKIGPGPRSHWQRVWRRNIFRPYST